MALNRAESNAVNALASTGPRTVEGKAKASKNAMRHGLTAKQVITPGESAEDFEAFEAELGAALAPTGALEALMVERVVLAAWRVRRGARIDAAFSVYQEEHRAEFQTLYEGLSKQGADGKDGRTRIDWLVTLSRYEAALERSLYRALHELQRAQATRAGERVPMPVVIDVEAGQGD